VFIDVVTESEIYYIYKSVLLTIKVAARNVSGVNKFIDFLQHNTTILDVILLTNERV
jgi:hypothetical protein